MLSDSVTTVLSFIGVNSPRTSGKNMYGAALPSPRLISNKLFRAPKGCSDKDHAQTLMVMVWGQFIDHDLTFTPVTQVSLNIIIDCNYNDLGLALV